MYKSNTPTQCYNNYYYHWGVGPKRQRVKEQTWFSINENLRFFTYFRVGVLTCGTVFIMKYWLSQVLESKNELPWCFCIDIVDIYYLQEMIHEFRRANWKSQSTFFFMKKNVLDYMILNQVCSLPGQIICLFVCCTVPHPPFFEEVLSRLRLLPAAYRRSQRPSCEVDAERYDRHPP